MDLADASSLGELYNELYPLEPLMVRNSSWSQENSYKFRWTNVWIGPKHATTQNHYDISYNFYVQIYGEKRFILFPPHQLHHLYLFPFLHPGAQQSQVNLSRPDLNLFPHFQETVAYEALLKPGDVLYLPPFWFHHVTALSNSISISVWTPTHEVEYAYETVRQPLPFKSDWSHSQLISASIFYLRSLVEHLLGENSGFLKTLFQQRFEPIAKQTELTILQQPKFCTSKEEIESVIDQTFFQDHLPLYEKIFEKEKQLFSKISDPYVRKIWLGNFCEQTALTIVGLNDLFQYMHDLGHCE